MTLYIHALMQDSDHCDPNVGFLKEHEMLSNSIFLVTIAHSNVAASAFAIRQSLYRVHDIVIVAAGLIVRPLTGSVVPYVDKVFFCARREPVLWHLSLRADFEALL